MSTSYSRLQRSTPERGTVVYISSVCNGTSSSSKIDCWAYSGFLWSGNSMQRRDIPVVPLQRMMLSNNGRHLCQRDPYKKLSLPFATNLQDMGLWSTEFMISQDGTPTYRARIRLSCQRTVSEHRTADCPRQDNTIQDSYALIQTMQSSLALWKSTWHQ